ncbi:hypothetical protein ACHAWO_003191 [Cyclotella atomus]|uniref:Uncharacterized protein n=1 Tax=Cyclotella atomus TaxID=382360 RepID=A0ABD3NPD8_9STRA
MRFLLKSARTTRVRANTSASKTHETAANRAWGQQCSPNCGCILRFDVLLSPPSAFSSSQTVLHACYNAKRVMTAPSSINDGRLRPLLTNHASLSPQPILTSCTCPTLHALAEQVVHHLPDKTLQTLRNEMSTGIVGERSSVPFRHTVLKENVLPQLQTQEKKWRISKEKEDNSNKKFTDTAKHFHCYDLVEESLLSLLHERQITSRNDTDVEAFSSTIGGIFTLYCSNTKTKTNPFELQEEEQQQISRHGAIPHENGWYRMSPSSYFLFGEDNAAVSTLNYLQSVKDAVLNVIFDLGEGNVTVGKKEDSRPTTTYLQLLDMYGNSTTEEENEDDKLDDWVNYVDQSRDQNGTG